MSTGKTVWEFTKKISLAISIVITLLGLFKEDQTLWIPSIIIFIILLFGFYFKKIEDNTKEIEDIKKDIDYYKKLKDIEKRLEILEYVKEKRR